LHYLLIFKKCLVMYFFTIVGFFPPPNATTWWDVVSYFFPSLRKWFKKGIKHCHMNAHEQRWLDTERYLCWGPRCCLYHPIVNWECFKKKSIANLCVMAQWLIIGVSLHHDSRNHVSFDFLNTIKRIGLAFLLLKNKIQVQICYN
jgi:hypothetical protein